MIVSTVLWWHWEKSDKRETIMAKVVNKSSSNSRRKQQHKKRRIKSQNPATKPSNELSPSNQFGNYRTVSISLSVILFIAGILLIAVPFFVSSNRVPGNYHHDFFNSKKVSHHTNILWPCLITQLKQSGANITFVSFSCPAYTGCCVSSAVFLHFCLCSVS